MNRVEKKFQQWTNECLKGKDSFEAVFPRDVEFRCRYGNSTQSVSLLVIIVWREKHPIFSYIWRKEDGKENIKKIAFIVRKQKKMMLCIDEDNFYCFGMADESEKDIKAMIFYQVGIEDSLIAASGDKKIEMLNYLPNDTINSMQSVVLQMFEEIENILAKKEGDEEKADGSQGE